MAKSRITPEQKARRAQLGQLMEGAEIKTMEYSGAVQGFVTIAEDRKNRIKKHTTVAVCALIGNCTWYQHLCSDRVNALNMPFI